MCHIMDKLHTLVPGKTTITHFSLPEEESEEILSETFHQLLVGGDQVTAARCRGSAAARCDIDTKTSRLYGLVPVSEDWHARLCLCKVCYLSSKTQWNLSIIKEPSFKGNNILESQVFSRTILSSKSTTPWVILTVTSSRGSIVHCMLYIGVYYMMIFFYRLFIGNSLIHLCLSRREVYYN